MPTLPEDGYMRGLMVGMFVGACAAGIVAVVLW